jgi:hypothetical protein
MFVQPVSSHGIATSLAGISFAVPTNACLKKEWDLVASLETFGNRYVSVMAYIFMSDGHYDRITHGRCFLMNNKLQPFLKHVNKFLCFSIHGDWIFHGPDVLRFTAVSKQSLILSQKGDDR